MNRNILEICTAYEQGYGHGYDKRQLSNPYRIGTDGYDAWDYGYSEGFSKRQRHDGLGDSIMGVWVDGAVKSTGKTIDDTHSFAVIQPKTGIF